MGEFAYCPVCSKIIGTCDHQRITMLIILLEALEKVNKNK